MTEREPVPDTACCTDRPPGDLRAGRPAATRPSAFYQQVFGFDQIFTEYIEVAGQGMFSRWCKARPAA